MHGFFNYWCQVGFGLSNIQSEHITERLQHFNCHAFCGTRSIYIHTHVHTVYVVMYIVDAYRGSLPNKVTANTEASVLSLCVHVCFVNTLAFARSPLTVCVSSVQFP